MAQQASRIQAPQAGSSTHGSQVASYYQQQHASGSGSRSSGSSQNFAPFNAPTYPQPSGPPVPYMPNLLGVPPDQQRHPSQGYMVPYPALTRYAPPAVPDVTTQPVGDAYPHHMQWQPGPHHAPPYQQPSASQSAIPGWPTPQGAYASAQYPQVHAYGIPQQQQGPHSGASSHQQGSSSQLAYPGWSAGAAESGYPVGYYPPGYGPPQGNQGGPNQGSSHQGGQ